MVWAREREERRMFAGRPVQTWLKVALIAIVAYVLLGHFVRYAVLPLAVGLVGYIVYRIVVAESSRTGLRPVRREKPVRRLARGARLNVVRFDPNEDVTVPKDWR